MCAATYLVRGEAIYVSDIESLATGINLAFAKPNGNMCISEHMKVVIRDDEPVRVFLFKALTGITKGTELTLDSLHPNTSSFYTHIIWPSLQELNGLHQMPYVPPTLEIEDFNNAVIGSVVAPHLMSRDEMLALFLIHDILATYQTRVIDMENVPITSPAFHTDNVLDENQILQMLMPTDCQSPELSDSSLHCDEIFALFSDCC